MKISMHFNLFILFLFLFVFHSTDARRRSLKGYEIIEINTTNSNNHEKLKPMLHRYSMFDVWKEPNARENRYIVLASARGKKRLKRRLQKLKLPYRVNQGVESMVAETMRANNKRRSARNRLRFNEYNKYRTIIRWMKNTEGNNRDLVTLVQVGTTFKGRKIWGLKISVKTSNRSKPVFWQDSLIHAREWISGATLLWVTNEIINDYRRNDSVIRDLLSKLDFIIVPVWNVDGYIYSWTNHYNRLWRKSRRSGHNQGADCEGVDLNRNFDTPNIDVDRRSGDICSPVYRGDKPFSEPETETVTSYMKTLNLAAYINVHSFSQLWLYPFGFNRTSCLDCMELNEVSTRAVTAMESIHGEVYTQGSIIDLAYPVGGGSIDWVYLSLCVKHSYAIELRDKGRFMFLLPRRFIVPTAQEYYAGFKEVAIYVGNSTSLVTTGCRNNR